MKTHETDCPSDENHPNLRDRLIHAIVQPVPDGLALCEFECAKSECSVEEWKHCTRRLEALKPTSGGR